MSTSPTGYLTHVDGRMLLTWQRRFDRPVEHVWAAVTDSDRLSGWIGTWAGVPSDGFVTFKMNAEGDEGSFPARYNLPRCEAPRLLRVTSVSASGSWELGLDLVEADGSTTLTFTHRVDDPGAVPDIGPGWEYYLDRLVTAESGGDVDGIDWDAYYPAQCEFYRELVAPSDDVTSDM